MFGNVGGSVPTTKAAVMTSTDALLTAVVADTVNDATVLHVGTADGRIKKVSSMLLCHAKLALNTFDIKSAKMHRRNLIRLGLFEA